MAMMYVVRPPYNFNMGEMSDDPSCRASTTCGRHGDIKYIEDRFVPSFLLCFVPADPTSLSTIRAMVR